MNMRSTIHPIYRSAQGFTLIELIIAVGIFALLATVSYALLGTVIDTKTRTEARIERLAALQKTMQIMERDFSQAVARPARDEYGDMKGALVATIGQGLEWTRTGWAVSPFVESNTVRSELQRVHYHFEQGQWIRSYWVYPDRAPQEKPLHVTLLDKVDSVSMRFLYRATPNAKWQWIEEWPPRLVANESVDLKTQETEQLRLLPKAVEIVFVLAPYGEIKRHFLLIDHLSTRSTALSSDEAAPPNRAKSNRFKDLSTNDASGFNQYAPDAVKFYRPGVNPDIPEERRGTDERQDIQNATIR
jgi:general secretion pathway protein J